MRLNTNVVINEMPHSASSSLLRLPVEVLLEIYAYTSPNDLTQIALTCKHLDLIINRLDLYKIARDTPNRSKWAPLHTAVLRGDVSTIRTLVQRGVDVHREDEFGLTPLHRAAEAGNMPVLYTLLMECGADPNREVKVKQELEMFEMDGTQMAFWQWADVSPMDYAYRSNSIHKMEVIEVLKQAGAACGCGHEHVEGLGRTGGHS